MAYKKIKSYTFSEEELRQMWSIIYCEKPIVTFDDIKVYFYSSMFDHCFYESENRHKKDKSILSHNRLQRIHWIKDALEDPNTIKKQGYIKKIKAYKNSRRVTLVKGNYIVVIQIYANKKARFITAYEVNDAANLELIKNSPDWT